MVRPMRPSVNAGAATSRTPVLVSQSAARYWYIISRRWREAVTGPPRRKRRDRAGRRWGSPTVSTTNAQKDGALQRFHRALRPSRLLEQGRRKDGGGERIARASGA